MSPVATPERAERLKRLATAARVSRRVAEIDRDARDREIEDAERDGMGIREIARWCDLSPSQVDRIIGKRTASRQA